MEFEFLLQTVKNALPAIHAAARLDYRPAVSLYGAWILYDRSPNEFNQQMLIEAYDNWVADDE